MTIKKYESGCVMALPDENTMSIINRMSSQMIEDDVLYYEDEEEYGRELEPHVTIKFGLTTNYKESDMGNVISKIKPFDVTLLKIDTFTNEKFDVVKINVESDELRKLNSLFSKLPNNDEHPVYNPHLTLAYVKPGMGEQFKRNIKPVSIKMVKIKYSNPVGKYFYTL